MIEYKVRPVTKWVVTRFERSDKGASCGPICEVSGQASAESLAQALAEKDGGSFKAVDPEDLADIPLLLRRIAEQVESGQLRAGVGVLSLRAVGQRRPVVFGFGSKVNAVSECGRAAEEILRLSGVPPATKEQAAEAIKALAAICADGP